MTDTTTADLPIERWPVGTLLGAQKKAAADLAAAKAAVAIVSTEVGRRYAESVKQALKQDGKEHGTKTLPLQDGISLKGEVKKTVSWDSAKLMAFAQTLSWDRVAALFKIDFSISETIYKGVSALSPEMQKKIDDARTVKFGEPSVSLVRDEA